MYRTFLPLHKLLACTVWSDGIHVTRTRTQYILVHNNTHYALTCDKGGTVTHIRGLHGSVPDELISILKTIERK